MKLLKLLMLLFGWLAGAAAFGQSIQNVYPSQLGGVDGTNVTAAKVLKLPQIQPTLTYNASPTPSPVVPQPTQVSQWFQMNGNGAAVVEYQANTFTAYWGVQVSDNPTPVSTPGTGIHTVLRDCSTYATGGQGGDTSNYNFAIREGYKWIRWFVNPDVNNTGTLDTTVRLFGNPPPGDAARSYSTGVPWKSCQDFANSLVQSGAGTIYYDYKLPYEATGLNIYTDTLGVSGASTITTTLYAKDPLSGQLQSLAVNTATLAAGFTTMRFSPGYAAPYPVATPPAGETIFGVKLPQDLVIGDVFVGSGATTFTQSAAPIR